jgi:sulfonate transport system substrate-binding protein
LFWWRGHPDEFAQVPTKETGLPLDIARVSFDRNNRVSRSVDGSVAAQRSSGAHSPKMIEQSDNRVFIIG